MKTRALLLPLLAISALTACTAPDRSETLARDRLAAIQVLGSTDERSLPPRSGLIVFPGQAFGEWRLVSLTGVKLTGHRSIHLLVGDGSRGDGDVEAMSQCLRLRFRVGLQGPGMVFAAVKAGEVVPGDKMPGIEIQRSPSCTRGLDAVEKALSRFMQAPGIIEGRPGGRVAFVSRRGEALLERPSKLPTDLYPYTPWQMWGEWRVESMTIGDELLHEAGRMTILFKTGRIEAVASCKSWRLPYQQEGDRLTIQAEQIHGCERDDRYDERTFSKIMAGDVKIAQSLPTERLLVGSAGSIRLVRPWAEISRRN